MTCSSQDIWDQHLRFALGRDVQLQNQEKKQTKLRPVFWNLLGRWVWRCCTSSKANTSYTSIGLTLEIYIIWYIYIYFFFLAKINILIMYTHAIPNPATRKHILFTAWKFCYHLEAGNSSVGSLACQPSAGGNETWPDKRVMWERKSIATSVTLYITFVFQYCG